MATETTLHSNAFNSSGFVEGGVDPRTGQYTLSIPLLSLVGNDQMGPELPIRLFFNPYSEKNVGFGKGWFIELTQFSPGSRMLRLHTGESYKVTGSGSEPSIRERKQKTFRFYEDDAKSFRVVHKSLMEEKLSVYGDGPNAVALPSEIRAASGHRIFLRYTPDNQRLQSIVDGNGMRLLEISYGSTVTFDLHPDGKRDGNGKLHPLARYSLTLQNEELSRVDLPTDLGGSWRFEYTTAFGVKCLAKVSTPYGCVEDIGYGEYGDKGHLLPGGGRYVAIPRVTTHTVSPGAGQPAMKTTYTYTISVGGVDAQRNFVGNGSGISWQEDGEDNLYRASASYKYASTAHRWADGAIKETTQCVYNRYHLKEEEVTRRARHVATLKMVHHGEAADNFDDLPGYFQLPKETTRSWVVEGGESRVRHESPNKTTYDEYGNLTEQVSPDGKRVVITYYDADLNGFVRDQESVTEHPAPGGDAPAPVLRRRYQYTPLPKVRYPDAVVNQPVDTWLVQTEEILCEVVDGVEQAPLQVATTLAHNKPDDLLRHGRPKLHAVRMGRNYDKTSTSFVYRKQMRDVHPVLITEQRLTGFDHWRLDQKKSKRRNVSKLITLEQSIFTGLPLLNRDDNDVEIAYEYYAARLTKTETVSPNDDRYKASREYGYSFVSAAGEWASRTVVDVKGVATRSTMDGLGRVAFEERHDADSEVILKHQEFRRCKEFFYDELGQLASAIEFDWKCDEQMRLATRNDYDLWGQQTCETGPDGVKHYQESDPIGSIPEDSHLKVIMPTQTSWSESGDGTLRLGKTITWLNLFGGPALIRRFDLSGSVYSEHKYFHDGLGRNVREVDARNAVTTRAFDAFGRLVDETLPDRSVVHRDYAEHSSEDLPTKIAVNGIVLGEQVFDGLNRMTVSITGGRARHMFYEPGQNKPSSVITAAGNEITYDYVPQLGEDPTVRRIPGKMADYQFDQHNARLLSCSEEGQGISRQYFSTGEVKEEVRTIGEESWRMEYRTTLLGRQLSYTDVLGQIQQYHYDLAGRLSVTELGSTKSHFFYDGLGNMQCFVTLDGDQGLATELEYDHQGRECLRRFVFLNKAVENPVEDFVFVNPDVQALVDGAGLRVQGVQELGQQYTVLDQLQRKALRENGEKLRVESYGYDLRGRLEEYYCDGLLSHSPKDPAGKTIREQFYGFDAIDNIVWLYTGFEEEDGSWGDNEATYLFENVDPAQLSGVLNTHPDYVDFELAYDLDGNLVQDEKEKRLTYDALGRLSSYDGHAYGYDPLDRLASQEA